MTNATHYVSQFFPYPISRDIYGCKVISENLGYYSPNSSTPHLPEDIIRTARKNLVVRDGWANAYFHGYLPLTNLQAIVSGIKALGYTYVPLVPAAPLVTLSNGITACSLTFATQAGINYTVEYKTALSDSAWLPLTNVLGTGGDLTVETPGGGSQRYYRLRVE